MVFHLPFSPHPILPAYRGRVDGDVTSTSHLQEIQLLSIFGLGQGRRLERERDPSQLRYTSLALYTGFYLSYIGNIFQPHHKRFFLYPGYLSFFPSSPLRKINPPHRFPCRVILSVGNLLFFCSPPLRKRQRTPSRPPPRPLTPNKIWYHM